MSNYLFKSKAISYQNEISDATVENFEKMESFMRIGDESESTGEKWTYHYQYDMLLAVNGRCPGRAARQWEGVRGGGYGSPEKN